MFISVMSLLLLTIIYYENENINDGDLVIFEHTNVINNGDIGCFNIDNNEATCKIFVLSHFMLYP